MSQLIQDINQLAQELSKQYPINPPPTAVFHDPLHRTHWKANVWRALILCFHQRYGAKSTLLSRPRKSKSEGKSLRDVPLCVPGTVTKIDADSVERLLLLMRRVSKQHDDLCEQLRLKDTKRIQAARFLTGPQVLSILKPRSSEHADTLNKLLFMVVHKTHGIEGYRVANQESIPYGLPSILQPPLPKLKDKLNTYQEGVSTEIVPATRINALFRIVFSRIRRHVEPRAADDALPDDVFTAFVRSVQDWKTDFAALMPLVRRGWDEALFGYDVVVPEANDGDLVLWDTWHTTCGMCPSPAPTPKMVAFVHYFPASLLTAEQARWHTYAFENAPYDAGAGRARGAWNMFVDCYRTGHPFRTPYNPNLTLGRGTLTAQETTAFREQGYLVKSFRDQHFHSRDRHGKTVEREMDWKGLQRTTRDGFRDFFRVIANDDDWTYETMYETETNAGAARRKADPWHYYTDLMAPTSPLDPNQSLRKSHNPQGGGKLIAADSGMGPGTTLTNEPGHLTFTFSPFLQGVLASFYGPGRKVLVMPERFRIKASKGWKGAMHVDHAPDLPRRIFELDNEL